MSQLRPEYLHVLEAMSETEISTPDLLAQKTGSIHTVILGLAVLYYDGLVDIRTYRRTEAGTRLLESLRQIPIAVETDLEPEPSVFPVFEVAGHSSLAVPLSL